MSLDTISKSHLNNLLHRPKRKMRQNASKKETKYQQITFFRYL
jgi:hypothetical protein